MRLLVMGALLVALPACTVNVVDKRLDREEVALAFKQRDQVLKALVQEISILKQAKGKK